MQRWVKDRGLTIALLTCFAISFAGQVFAGWSAENAERARHAEAAMGLAAYLTSGAFLSAVFENWESEFLQMWAYVMLTAYLFQRGSPESKDPDEVAPQDRDPAAEAHAGDAPKPVRRGRLALALYSHSLGLALLALFAASFLLHWLNSARKANDEAMAHGAATMSVLRYLGDPEFWFESFQNWQSEFLSTAVLIVLAIWLREKGSPESKAVADPHAKTGNN
jgi:hypothetical protein